MHIQSCAYAQERPEKALKSHLWLNLRLCISRRWRLRQSCHHPAGASQASPNAHIEVLSKGGRLVGLKYLRKSLSNP